MCINTNVLFLAAYTVVRADLLTNQNQEFNSAMVKKKMIVQLQSCTALIPNLAKCLIIKHPAYYIRCKIRV